MRIRIFLKPESIVRILASKGRPLSWLRIRIGVSQATFSKIMGLHQTPSPKAVKLILKHMRGYSWDDIFRITTEEGGER